MNTYGAQDPGFDPPRSEPDPDYAYDQMREDQANALADREARRNLNHLAHAAECRCERCHNLIAAICVEKDGQPFFTDAELLEIASQPIVCECRWCAALHAEMDRAL